MDSSSPILLDATLGECLSHLKVTPDGLNSKSDFKTFKYMHAQYHYYLYMTMESATFCIVLCLLSLLSSFNVFDGISPGLLVDYHKFLPYHMYMCSRL